MRRICLTLSLLAASLLLVCSNAKAQLEKPVEKPIIGPRRPALSPDGTTLAFVYRGDIWTVPTTGGRAYRLTDHVEMDNIPIFSPDGQWISFCSARNGNYDLYVVPATGGSPTQITWSSHSEIAFDWSADGKALLFTDQRDVPDATLFSVDVRTLRFRPLLSDYKGISYAVASPDGTRIAYQRQGFPWTRPRYCGSSAAQLWTFDPATGKREQITRDDRQHLWPHFTPDGRTLLCVATGEQTPATCKIGEKLPKLVDNERRTPNLWAFGLDGKGKQLTHFTGTSVRWPTVARQSGDLAFEYGDGIWLLKQGAQQPVKLTIYAPSDDKESPLRRETLTGGVEEAECSPDGKTIAFRIQGELWSIPVEKPKKHNADDATRLTRYAGWDGDFVWSKDNKKLYYVSDRDGSLGLCELDVQTQATRSLWKGDGDAFNPRLSPDGKLVAFWVSGSQAGLYTWPVEGGPATRLIALPGTGARSGPGGRDFAFSPDMQWLAYTCQAEHDTLDLWIMPAKGGLAVNVTRLNAYHAQPVWSPDGRYLFFQSDRDGPGLYVLPLKQEDARADELEMKFTAPKADTPVKVEIDFQDIETRIRKHSGQNPEGDLSIGPDGTLYFLSAGDAWSVSFDGKETKRLTSGGGCGVLRLMPDAKKLLLVKGGALTFVTLGPNPQTSTHTFSALWERDIRAERRAAFIQFWRGYNRQFYDENFHGRDWSAIRERYEPLLDSVGTRDEFAGLLSMMVGELECSHSEVGTGTPPSGPKTPSLGFYFDYTWEGPGIRVKEVPPRSPGSYAKTRLNPGDYVLAVNGKDVCLDENLWRTLNDLEGKDLDLLVNKEPKREGARTVTYKALSWDEWAQLHYRNRVLRLRQEVDQRSNGKIAYVHIAGMGFNNQVQFEREFYEYTIGKDAVIVDVRFNGGGNIADTLTSWLAMRPYAFNRPRGAAAPEPVPGRAWDKPMAVLINESSMSNAEMFPYDMKQTGLATLVGMPTPGYVIWTWGFPLVDGTSARMPGSGVWRKDGTPLENCGQKPDLLVDVSADDWAAKRDPQLEAAVDYLMKKK